MRKAFGPVTAVDGPDFTAEPSRVAALVYLFVLEPFARGTPVVRDYYQYLPGGAFEALTGTTDPIVPFLEPWQGGLLLAAYAAAFAVAGSAVSLRRDIT